MKKQLILSLSSFQYGSLFRYFLLLLISCTFNVYSQIHTIETVPSVYNQNKTSLSYLSNPDNIIDAHDAEIIRQTLINLEAQTSIEVVVVALQSIGQQDSWQFANELFNHWKVGKPNKDNGLLMLLVLDQREIVSEVGYGLEGVFPDVISYRLQQNYMVPLLKENQFSAGMREGVIALADYFQSEEIQKELDTGTTSQKTAWSINWTVVLSALIIAILITLFSPKIGLDKYRDAEKILKRSDLFAIIFSCLLFIPFPLFFIYLSWYRHYYRKKLKKLTIRCPKCNDNQKLVALAKQESDPHLNKQQKFEDQTGAVKYSVYQCNSCQFIFAHQDKITGKYSKCTKCDTIAFYVKSTKVLKHATYSTTGLEKQRWCCAYCHYETVKEVSIAKKVRSTSSSSGSGRSGGGGGSYGGGRSGGGGSRSSF